MNPALPVPVVIVEDQEDIRGNLAAFIGGTEGFICAGSYPTGEDALDGIDAQRAQIILMDIDLPGMSGIECIKKLKTQNPSLQIMMLTVFEDDEKIFQSLAAGASGYLLKKTPPAKLIEAIRDLASGGSPMSSQIARKVVQVFQQTKSAPGMDDLSSRETEILGYLARGYRYKEIADKLFISIETVRTHLRNIYEKLHVRSRTEAVLRYLEKKPRGSSE